jgi:hypothetical protein
VWPIRSANILSGVVQTGRNADGQDFPPSKARPNAGSIQFYREKRSEGTQPHHENRAPVWFTAGKEYIALPVCKRGRDKIFVANRRGGGGGEWTDIALTPPSQFHPPPVVLPKSQQAKKGQGIKKQTIKRGILITSHWIPFNEIRRKYTVHQHKISFTILPIMILMISDFCDIAT